MKALYLTADQIGAPTGGGRVTFNERLAMIEAGYEVDTIVPARHPAYKDLDLPFLEDYFASREIEPGEHRLVHVYSGTFSQSLRRIDDIRRGGLRYASITMTVPAHNRKATIRAHEKAGIPYSYPHIKDPDLWKAFSEGIHLADRVIVPSTHSRDALLEEGVPPDKMVIIPHGIEAVPEVYAPPPAQYRVGAFGQIVGPDKGITTLIEAWGRLGLTDSECWLAGRGTEHLGPMIERLAPKGKFRLLGYMENASTFYNNVSVVCAPSITEAFGIGALEALAHGRGVIVSTGAGASGIVDDNPDVGYVFPAGDVGRLVELIGQDHEAYLAGGRWSPNFTRALAAEHTWEKIRPQYIALWKSLL